MFIRECMTKNPVTIEPGDTLARADAKMKAGGFRRLPVVYEGKLIGILSEYDLRGYSDSARTCRSPAQGKRDWRPARG
jgi:acetoin utilization protein AcuB